MSNQLFVAKYQVVPPTEELILAILADQWPPQVERGPPPSTTMVWGRRRPGQKRP